MAEQNKTRRFFDLIRWLQKEGQAGISKARIIDEYGISEKTFSRDIEELADILPGTIKYDADDQRLFANLFNPQGAKNETSSASIALPGSIAAHTKSGQSLPSGSLLFHQPQNTLKISEREYSQLLESVIENTTVEFVYRDKRRLGVPLFFCYYAERWYLFVWMSESALIHKFRLDQFQSVVRPLIPSPSSSPDLSERRKEAAEKIRQSHNIFVDINAAEKLKIHFRFFRSVDYLKRELSAYETIEPALSEGRNEKDVSDVRIAFSGYQEAQIFMNKWLGHFQILEPADIRLRYLSEIEEAMDIL
jgi:predicted DNA-binding transcriptional regulator YafY